MLNLLINLNLNIFKINYCIKLCINDINFNLNH